LGAARAVFALIVLIVIFFPHVHRLGKHLHIGAEKRHSKKSEYQRDLFLHKTPEISV
jgi:hypothetical protein